MAPNAYRTEKIILAITKVNPRAYRYTRLVDFCTTKSS
jgi:hypothetical protein